jgi:hypothetical protein
MSQKWMSQLRSVVGKKALEVGRVRRSMDFMRPMWTKPVKKMTVLLEH